MRYNDTQIAIKLTRVRFGSEIKKMAILKKEKPIESVKRDNTYKRYVQDNATHLPAAVMSCLC